MKPRSWLTYTPSFWLYLQTEILGDRREVVISGQLGERSEPTRPLRNLQVWLFSSTRLLLQTATDDNGSFFGTLKRLEAGLRILVSHESSLVEVQLSR